MVMNVKFLKHIDFILKPLNQCKSNNKIVYINLLKLRH